MKSAIEILHKWGYKKEYSGVDKIHVIEAMKEYARQQCIDVIRYMREDYGDKLMWEIALVDDEGLYNLYEQGKSKE